jgi:hypothetical protein
MRFFGSLTIFFFLMQTRTVMAHGIGESFKAISDFSLVYLIFGSIRKSVRAFDGVIFDEVAGFVVYVIFFTILVLITNYLLKKINHSFVHKYSLFISIFTIIIFSHTKLIFLFVYLLSIITKSTADFAGIISIIVSYALLMLLVFFLNKKVK